MVPIVRSNNLSVKHSGLVFKEKCSSSDDMTEVAKKLHISTQELSNFVNGKSAVSIELGVKLEQLTGISVEF